MASSPSQVRALLDAIEEPALLVQYQRIAAANRSARDLLGARIEGSDIRLAIRHPEALEHILGGVPGKIAMVGLGGAERPWELSVRPLADGMQLVRLTDRSSARAAERMRVDFVANASHELRTPLATIIGYAETLSEAGDIDPATRTRFGTTIHREARRMLRIVEDLMSLSRIEADRFVTPRDKVSLEEIVRIAAENGRPLAEARGCRILVEVESSMRPIAGDFAQLLQLTDNLVANALRYGCGVKDCDVTVIAGRDGDRALLAVRDTGDGIDPILLPRLTERFYRIDAARSRDAGGTGLGLAIVKHIVERHRGSLEIKSTPGRGTEVLVRLSFADGPSSLS
jgi:two-component system, OmpR family, phosphate regulon sensor histidine kinase PhoR